MSSREQILAKLRRISSPFAALEEVPPAQRQPVSPLADTAPAALRERFIAEASALPSTVYEASDAGEALEIVLGIIGAEKQVMCWDFAHIPLPGLEAALATRAIQRTGVDAEQTQVGITGVDAALVATGSLVLMGSAQKAPQVSLLPMIHIALLREDRLLPDLESFVAQQRAADPDAFRNTYNMVIITGPSKTADIASELVMGVHGPGELHVILLPAPPQSAPE